MHDILQDLSNLTNDESFIALSGFYRRTNTFRVCGMSHMELWHSHFMAWLLNPNETHGLGMYPVERYLSALTKVKTKPDVHPLPQALELLASSSAWVSKVTPEHPALNRDRIDVFGTYTNEADKQIVLTVEQKVGAKIDAVQFPKYVEYVEGMPHTAKERLLIFVGAIPAEKIKSTSSETFESDAWFALDYQTVLDEVLYPCAGHPMLDIYSRQTIREYIDALSSVNNKLAITREEKELAAKIKEKHGATLAAVEEIFRGDRKSDVWEACKEIMTKRHPHEFEALKTILNRSWNFSGSKDNATEEYIMTINGEELRGRNLYEIVKKALLRAAETGVDLDRCAGFKSERSAYYFFHNDSSKMEYKRFRAISVNGKDYYFRNHFSAENGMRLLQQMLAEAGLTVEVQLVVKNRRAAARAAAE